MKNEETVVVCPDCSDEISVFDRYEDQNNGEVTCGECHDRRNTINCYHCSATVNREDFENGNYEGEVDEDGDWICGDHFMHCEWCNETMRNVNVCYMNGTAICQGCFDEECTSCEDCGNNFTMDDLTYSDAHEGYYCEACYTADPDDCEGVPVHTCPTCGTDNVHFDTLGERYVCVCAAMSLPFVLYRGGRKIVWNDTMAETCHVGQIG